ncbi:2-keto-4-pentenoate hydratase/2-oxohepta-3-ene-1,7-dioic acid hydratase in catechol pathway [Actinomycetospora succinea]|uniref:2-keto-4-pentenoate hydratase/2-oxohepta-3-ene-1,7-dioic acid hydratase in catechol pathway n=1 Tax=Actinomycetospora succinea TaxID=663603 RepID=A0A4R6VK49_9PSEU|nr:fumarylacetoacetate hydrolase family protein [Actinomycetospora succinea]TDQ63226.1 2-keto-4-pentenoate hydratase/2-oxohepta-3-ene-1,7-dioic acid hydratase in catechol pathway [Actinomycetospora succinea]
MKLVTFVDDGREAVGRLDGDDTTVRDLTPVVGTVPLLAVIEDWHRVGPAIAAAGDLPVVDAPRLRAPIPAPRRDLFAVGKNYREHVAEFGRSGYDTPGRSEDLPDKPIVFSKATTAVTGPFDDVEAHPAVTAELDYEAELAVIIGPGGRGISREDAFDHVWGYTIVNDVTARDVQRDHKQWLLGKSLDTHAPMGPWAVTADEVPDVRALEVSSTVNGEPRQKAPVADLIFDVPELIRVISAGITLLPGDVIATGTPVGVGIGFDPPRFLRPGDVVECAVTGLGALRNTIR